MLPAFFHQTPFFRLLLPFIAGIVFGFYITIPAIFCLWICMALGVGILLLLLKWKNLVLHHWDWLYGTVLHAFLILIGICTASLHQIALPQQTEQGVWLVVVEEPPVEKEKSMKATVRIRANLANDSTTCNEKIITYFRKDDAARNIKQGDLLLMDAELKPVVNAGNPYEFDYQGYLNKRHIGRSAFVESDKWQYLDSYAQGPLLNLSNRIRNVLLGIYARAGLSGNELAVASALVLGYKADLDDMLRGAYSASGAMHVLAVSGLHVGIIYFILNSLLTLIPFLRRVKWLRALLLLTALWLYALITGMPPSVMRASTMFSFIIVGEAFHRRAYIYNSIAASAFVLLLINPANLFDVGFQLSYMAVTAIVFFHPHLYGLFSFKRWLPDQIWSLTCVSIAAQIGTVPLSLYYFHQFPSYFMLTNLIVIPAASVIIYGSFLLFIISPVATLLGAIGWLLDKFIYFINSCIFFIEKLPGSVIWGIRFQGWEVLLSYSIGAIISIWALTTRKMYLFASLVCCLFWVAGATIRDSRDLQRQQLIVYHMQGNSLLQFTDGRNNVIWYASRNPSSFHASHLTEYQRIAMQLKEAECILLDSALLHRRHSYIPDIHVSNNFIQFADKRLAIFTRNLPPQDAGQQTVKIDAVILTQNVNAKIPQIIKSLNPDVVVLDASNTLARIDRWEKDCCEAGVKCHRLDRDGAFIMASGR